MKPRILRVLRPRDRWQDVEWFNHMEWHWMHRDLPLPCGAQMSKTHPEPPGGPKQSRAEVDLLILRFGLLLWMIYILHHALSLYIYIYIYTYSTTISTGLVYTILYHHNSYSFGIYYRTSYSSGIHGHAGLLSSALPLVRLLAYGTQ